MSYINEETIYNDEGNVTGKRIVITGNPPWKMRIFKVLDDGSRLPFWRANNDEDLIEWIQSLISDGELNEETMSFVIAEGDKDLETVGEYCKRKGIS